METVTERHRFAGNSFEIALLPFALTAATADFWSKPRGANVWCGGLFSLPSSAFSSCSASPFPSLRKVSVGVDFRLSELGTLSPLQLRVGSLARCGRLAFPVAVEVVLPKWGIRVKRKIYI
jgi:hypothetical protein